MRVPRLRASPRHGGARNFSAFLLRYRIRRGGAPSGAAGFIVMEDRPRRSCKSELYVITGNLALKNTCFMRPMIAFLAPALSPFWGGGTCEPRYYLYKNFGRVENLSSPGIPSMMSLTPKNSSNNVTESDILTSTSWIKGTSLKRSMN